VRRPRRALSRSRSILIGAIVLIVILVLQAVASIIGVVVTRQQSTVAAKDTFSYVGALTAERVARYAATAEEVVEATTHSIDGSADLTLDEVARVLYLNLSRAPQVRGAYVGFPDGRFVSVSHDGTGYSSQQVEVSPVYHATQSAYNARFTTVSTTDLDIRYDPRDRPWFLAGKGSVNTVWTQPYLLFGSDVTFASVARAARGASHSGAVTGADLNVDDIATILDSLPIGDGAQAFVLSPDRRVIAAPSDYSEQLRATAALTGEVPQASDINVGSQAVAQQSSDGEVFGETGGRLTLERGFPPREGLDWILHLEADEGELSPGLGRLQVTIYAITMFSALVVAAVAVVLYRLWRPLRGLSYRARTDQLTGLSNRHEHQARGAALLSRAEFRREIVVVAVFDLDRFKELNDDLGHDAGDTALVIVGDALLAAARENDVTARLGGDEFVMMQVVPTMMQVPGVVERVRATVEHTVRAQAPGGQGLGLTAGYSLSRAGHFDLDILMTEADAALVAGKRVAKGETYRYERPIDVT